MRSSLVVFTVAAALSLAATAWGDEKAPPTFAKQDPRAAVAETDTNKDGQIDREEFHHRSVEVFFFADADKNGSLSAIEFQKLDDDPATFAAIDKNHDGKVTMTEYIAYRFEQFQLADKDGSGTLSIQEVMDFVGK